MALSGLKPVVVQLKPILIFHPPGAAKNAQNLSPPHVKNFACGLGGNPNPQVATTLSGIKLVVVQIKPTLALHPSGAAKNA